jgi:fused signal recognition particle receptor
MAQIPWETISKSPTANQLSHAKTQIAQVLESWFPIVSPAEWPAKQNGHPTVILFVGVNGVGKTTSLAKFAQELKSRGHSVLMGAGDTFRAAAGEQLETWATRIGVPCVRGAEGADPASVLFDAIQSGIAKNVDFVLCDSAGRLHNQSQLMDALAKVTRVMNKALPGAPHETLLVLDANTGGNMLAQAETFQKSTGVTGLVLTKLDGTARGGAVIAVARKTQLPIRRLGLGESANDLVPFESQKFTEALLGIDK